VFDKKPGLALSLGAVAAGVMNGRQGAARPRPFPPPVHGSCREFHPTKKVASYTAGELVNLFMPCIPPGVRLVRTHEPAAC
jgi:hypothetical protein